MLLEQHLVFVYYLNLLQLAYNILWNRNIIINNQLFNNHFLWPVEIFRMLLHVLKSFFSDWLKKFSIDHNKVIFYFHSRKEKSCVTVSNSYIFKWQTKSLFTLWKLGSIIKPRSRFRACSVLLDWYLFQAIVLLKPDSNCFNIDKVVTRG